MSILELAKKYEEDIIQDRRYFHENAESGYDLKLTTARIIERLEEMGYEPKIVGNSGVLAQCGGKKAGKTFLLRGDVDALPMIEETDEVFKSRTENMHACGHDFHAAMLLGAARILKDLEDEIEGTVKLMFQPAEELLTGAKTMIDDGILKNPSVDAAFMLHIFSGFPVETGRVLFLEDGPVMASHDRFEIRIKGIGCHGAMASEGVDPLIALSNIHLGLQSINSREIPAGELLVVTVGKMGGGTTANIIPDTASMTGTIRAYSPEIRELAKKRIVDIAKSTGSAYRCEVEVDFFGSCPALVNDEKLHSKTKEYTRDLLSKELTIDLSDHGMGRFSGSEDFAFVAEKVPATMMAISASLREGEIFPMHHPKVKFDESILSMGSAVHANNAIKWLKENK